MKGSKHRGSLKDYKASTLWCPRCGYGKNSCKCPKKKKRNK